VVPTLAGGLTLLAAAGAAGVMNALAGGGTILTYPALLFSGVDPIVANATSTVALLPGAASSMFGYRRELATHRRWLSTLWLPSLVGGGLGSLLLLATPPDAFRRLAPLLVLFATGLFVLQGFLARARASAVPTPTAADGAAQASPLLPVPARLALAMVLQFLVAIYGGYFGAGIGILMLALLGFLSLTDIHAMNGLKNFFGLTINGVAALLFLARGVVDLPLAALMALGAAAGGYGGARLARRIGRDAARRAVVAIGILVAILLAWQS
jgi:uncharacterized membrane protein YfcA